MLFGAVFAVNSSLHSYLIVSYAKDDGVSLDVGFYYMANAIKRLIGTILSGWVFQLWGWQLVCGSLSAFSADDADPILAAESCVYVTSEFEIMSLVDFVVDMYL